MTKELAKNAPRFSIVRYQGNIYVLENNMRNPQLIYEEDGKRKGKTITGATELEIVLYPAQAAFEMLEILRGRELYNQMTNEQKRNPPQSALEAYN